MLSSATAATLPLPPRLSLARTPTPLHLLARASERWGRGKRLWIKRDDTTGALLSGNKVRKLEFVLAHARAQGHDALITCGGIQSNHARATAAVCAQAGLHCELVLRGHPTTPTANHFLDTLLGASVSIFPPEEYIPNLDNLLEQTAQRLRNAGMNPLILPTGGSNGLGIWGYVAAAEELTADLSREGVASACVVAATGSGGTQAGLSLGMEWLESGHDVVGMAVCDDAAWFNNKVLADVEDARQYWPQLPSLPVTPRTVDDYIGSGYGIAGTEVYQLIAELAQLEGIVLDPVYTAKAFQGLVGELAAGRLTDKSDIVFVHTGGIFGLFAHEDQLLHAQGLN